MNINNVTWAVQWFQNGDCPGDHDEIGIFNPTNIDIEKYLNYKETPGKIVKKYPVRPKYWDPCLKCGGHLNEHGEINNKMVCPGDWIIESNGHHLLRDTEYRELFPEEFI